MWYSTALVVHCAFTTVSVLGISTLAVIMSTLFNQVNLGCATTQVLPLSTEISTGPRFIGHQPPRAGEVSTDNVVHYQRRLFRVVLSPTHHATVGGDQQGISTSH